MIVKGKDMRHTTGVSWKPTQSCGTIGELKKALIGLPDDTPIRAFMARTTVKVRYENEKGSPDGRWATVGD